MRASVAAPKLERLPTWVRSRRQAMLAAEQPFPVPRVEALGLRWEIALVAGILLIAAALRFWHLTSLPAGLHGDEAWTGIEGRRILREGWIGPYSPSALGQPSGPLYVTAVAVWLFGNTIFAVRLVPALMGLLTIAALYVVIRRNLGTWAALAGAALLALMDWHIHFSRIGFPLAAWPLTVVLAAGALMEALRTQDWRWWAAAGALTGLGIYAYNADPVFVAIVGLFALYTLYRWAGVAAVATLALFILRPGVPTLVLLAGGVVAILWSPLLASRARLQRAAAFGVALLVVAFPMIRFAADPHNGYLDHARTFALVNRSEWTQRDTLGKAWLVVRRYFAYWNTLTFHPRLDAADATGITAVVPISLLLLAVLGIALALWRRRGPLVALGLMVILLMPFASVFTIEGLARRTFASAPFVALFAGLAIVELLALFRPRRALLRYPVAVGLAVLVAFTVYRNLDDYYGTFAHSATNPWVFAQEMTQASLFMAKLPPGSHVYFYSARWSVNYETRRYLAPNVSAEDRSKEFGHYSLAINPSQGRPVFVLLAPYETLLPDLERLYPGGRVVQEGPAANPWFVAYEVG